jgi:hypothetical protein
VGGTQSGHQTHDRADRAPQIRDDEACAEIGVLPGREWAVVRATRRHNLKHRRRRNATYPLLNAWYDFHGTT